MSEVDERRRIERALHDGVQQDLIAASVRLQLARQLAATDADGAIALLDEIREDVRAALDRVRELANDIYPSVLDIRGLPEALRAANAAVTIDAAGLGRQPAHVEAAAYFCCKALLDRAAVIRLRVQTASLELELESPQGFTGASLDMARSYIEAAGGTVSVSVRSDRLAASIPTRSK